MTNTVHFIYVSVNSLEERIKKMQWIHSPLSMKKGKHWDIRFAQIAEKPADLKVSCLGFKFYGEYLCIL